MKLGKHLKRIRKHKNMTLEELSRKSGVALATLSRIENEKMTGTLKSHIAICKALGISITELYKCLEDEQKTVETVPQKQRTEHFTHSAKAKYELLVPQPRDKKIMPLALKIAPGGKTAKERTSPGIEKFMYVLKGKVNAQIGEEEYELKKGDSLYFDGSLPHIFMNKSNNNAEAICAVSPPEI